MAESEAAREKRRERARRYNQKKRDAARMQHDTPTPSAALDDFAPPLVVHAAEPALALPPSPPGTPAPAPVPQPLPPLPDFGLDELPAYQPFAYETETRLTGPDLLAITEYYNKYLGLVSVEHPEPILQAQLRRASPAEKLRLSATFYRDAESIVPYLERQYRQACEGVGGAQSQEAQQVKRNLDWTTTALAKRDASLTQRG